MTSTYNQELSSTLKIPIARLGAWEHPLYKYVVFEQKDFNDIKRNFEANEWGFEPYLRYGHSRYTNAADGEPATAFLKKVDQEGDVLFGHFEAVDPTVVDEIKKGTYRYSSSEITRNAPGKQIGRGDIGTILTAVSLTNAPFVPGLPQNQVLSQSPAEPNFFVLDQKELPMPQSQETEPENTVTLLQKLSSGMTQILQVLSSNPFAAKGGEARHGDLEKLANAPLMPGLKEMCLSMSKGQDETDESHQNRFSMALSGAYQVYMSNGKSEDNFKNDIQQVCSMMSGMGAEFGPVAQMFTASILTDTPVYKNGSIVKGHDASGTNYSPETPKPAQAGEKFSNDPDHMGGPSSQEMSAGKAKEPDEDENDGKPPWMQKKTEKHTASASAPDSQLFKNGERVKGPATENLSDNGGETRDFHAMPDYQAAGPAAYLVQAFSQSAAVQAAADAAPAPVSQQLSTAAAGAETPSAQSTQEEGKNMPDVNNEAIEARFAALEQRLSQTVSALETVTAEKSQLKSQLDATAGQLTMSNQQLSQLAAQAATSATESAELKLSQRAVTAKQNRIPPVLVDEVVAMVKGAGFEQKLSMGGAESPLADALFGLLDKLPQEYRVNLSQVGAKQNLSNTAGQAGSNEAFAYEGIFNERMGNKA